VTSDSGHAQWELNLERIISSGSDYCANQWTEKDRLLSDIKEQLEVSERDITLPIVSELSLEIRVNKVCKHISIVDKLDLASSVKISSNYYMYHVTTEMATGRYNINLRHFNYTYGYL
jgi:hypothetical protein